MNDDEFFSWLEDEPSDLQCKLLRTATSESIKQGLEGKIDFSDQIFLPTIFPSSFPQYPLVLIDEAQDLSALNHATLRKLAKKRIIAVGDECQAIYGFRGAHEDSMPLLKQTFNMRELILSISFRCPVNIVKEAQWRAPHMRFPEWAKPGAVTRINEWTAPELPEDAVIICRNNAPIFTAAIRLLRNGRYPKIIGNDIGANLLKILKKLGKPDLSQSDVLEEIEKWKEARLKKSRSKGKVEDMAACLRIFAEQGKDLSEACAYAEHIFNSSGPIQLMTGHKSKGLEFNNVFFLDEHLIKCEEEPQEKNLKYVIQTRSKSSLTYINSTDFVEV